MKILIDIGDMHKLRNVAIAFDVVEHPDGVGTITMVCSQKRKDGTYEIFHQDTFATQE